MTHSRKALDARDIRLVALSSALFGLARGAEVCELLRLSDRLSQLVGLNLCRPRPVARIYVVRVEDESAVLGHVSCHFVVLGHKKEIEEKVDEVVRDDLAVGLVGVHNFQILVFEDFVKLVFGRNQVSLAQHDGGLVHLNDGL